MSANTSPLAQLTAAEATLVQAVECAAARIDRIATKDLDAALARLRQSAEAAKERLLAATRAVNAVAGDVLNFLDDVSAGIGEDLLNDAGIYPPASLEPAQAEQPQPETSSTPATSHSAATNGDGQPADSSTSGTPHAPAAALPDVEAALPPPDEAEMQALVEAAYKAWEDHGKPVATVAACQPIDPDETVDLGAELPPPPQDAPTLVLPDPQGPPAAPPPKRRKARRR